MSIQSRVSFGFGYGALAVAMMGYVVVEQPTTSTPQVSHGGGGHYIGQNYSRSDTRPRDTYLARALQEDEELVHLITHAVTQGLLQ